LPNNSWRRLEHACDFSIAYTEKSKIAIDGRHPSQLLPGYGGSFPVLVLHKLHSLKINFYPPHIPGREFISG
jgi:hypothetical protein